MCSSLTSINLPSSLQSLGNECFSECSSLISINLPSLLQSLGNSCFSWCSSLTSINLPSSLQYVGYNCFSGCSQLPSHIENQFLIEISKISNFVNSISDSISHKIETLQLSNLRISFTFCNEQLNEIQNWETIEIIYEDFKIENNIISKLEPKKRTILFHPIIKSLGNLCFANFSSLISINLSSSLQSLGNCGFSNCFSLKSINLPLSIQSIGYNFFDECDVLPTEIQNQFKKFIH
jgi:hypothetical protein